MTTKASPPSAASGNEPVLTLIKQIKDNKVDPGILSAEDRCRCVEVLCAEGYSVADAAQILKVAERTIYRDRLELRRQHALRVDPEFAPQMAGELMRQAEGSVGRLRRIAKEPNASAMERAMAESFAFKVYLDMLTKLQSMGYLPRIPTGVVAQVVDRAGTAIATCDQLARRLEELERVDRELGLDDPQRAKQRHALKDLVLRGRTAAELDQMVEGGGQN